MARTMAELVSAFARLTSQDNQAAEATVTEIVNHLLFNDGEEGLALSGTFDRLWTGRAGQISAAVRIAASMGSHVLLSDAFQDLLAEAGERDLSPGELLVELMDNHLEAR